MKINNGDTFENFQFNTVFENGLDFSEYAKKVDGKTILLFLRYYGCTICQYDIHLLAENYNLIKEKNAQLLIVLQSTQEIISSQITKNDLPFDIICDPKMELYNKYSLEVASSMAKMADLKAVGKIAKAKSKGLKHGEYEGEELQLPAIFIMNKDLNVSYAHYAKTVSDIPDIKKLLQLI